MAKVKLEVNTDSEADGSLAGDSKPAAAVFQRTYHIVTTIRLDGGLKDAFESGAGDRVRIHHDKDYDDLRQYIRDNLNEPQYLVATAGGSITFEAAKEVLTQARFVSLVGTMPNSLGACFGGVTMDCIGMNPDRVDYLEGQGHDRAGIGLFCNKKSAMNLAEVAEWGRIPGVSRIISYGGNNLAGKNDPNVYRSNFDEIDPSVTALIISADPFFQKTKNKLIKAANDWIAATPGRRICYPLSDYANPEGNPNQKPKTGSYWYGPSLMNAYEELGRAAALAKDAANPVGFSDITITKGPFKNP
jgi:hypothetical protein